MTIFEEPVGYTVRMTIVYVTDVYILYNNFLTLSPVIKRTAPTVALVMVIGRYFTAKT